MNNKTINGSSNGLGWNYQAQVSRVSNRQIDSSSSHAVKRSGGHIDSPMSPKRPRIDEGEVSLKERILEVNQNTNKALVRLIFNTANNLLSEGKFDQAIQYYKMCEANSDFNILTSEEKGYFYYNYAIFLKELGCIKAFQYFESASIYFEFMNKFSIKSKAQIFWVLADFYYIREEYIKSKEFYEVCFNEYLTEFDEVERMDLNWNLGVYYSEAGDYAKAKKHCKNCLNYPFIHQLFSEKEIGILNEIVANAYKNENKYGEAFIHYEACFNNFQYRESLTEIEKGYFYRNFALACEETGRYEKAFDLFNACQFCFEYMKKLSDSEKEILKGKIEALRN